MCIRDSLIVIPQVRHQNLILIHNLVVGPDRGQIDAAGSGTDREIICSFHSIHSMLGISHVVDEGLGRLDAGGIAVIEDTKAPYTALKGRFAALGRESHKSDLLAGDRLFCAGTGCVGIELLRNIPAESHLQHALIELGDFVAACQRSVESDTLHTLELFKSLDIQGIVPGIPVSYTHLDVYKRQAFELFPKHFRHLS